MAEVLAVTAANGWLLCFIVVTATVLVAGAVATRRARPASNDGATPSRDLRRYAGALVALGPLVGLAFAPNLDGVGGLTLVVAFGAPVLAIGGVLIDRARQGDRGERTSLDLVVVAAVVAVVVGARLEPTGVGALDVIGGLLFLMAVTKSTDGAGRVDGFVPIVGSIAGAGLFAIAAFDRQDALAAVLVGLVGACAAMLAFNLRPASIDLGLGGRLAVGFALAVGALAVNTSGASWRGLVTPLVALLLFWLDALIVLVGRLRRRESLLHHLDDHLIHRLIALGWSTGWALTFLAVCQLVLSAIALFTARAVMPLWLALASAFVVFLVVAITGTRAKVQRDQVVGLPRWTRIALVVVIVLVVLAPVPLALSARDTVDQMKDGRDAAKAALRATRDGDTEASTTAFREAARAFGEADNTLGSPLAAGGLAVPFLAENVNAVRTLASVGTSLADAGESLSAAVDPDALKVVDGRLPVEEVERITPKLEEAASVLGEAHQRLDALRNAPYLAAPIKDAIDDVYEQLARADREAQRSVAAAKLAPAIFGADGERTYLLVVQNNAESRATGGFIGSYALMTANNGDLHVGEIIRTRIWNEAVRAKADISFDAPADYRRRYGALGPETNLQNVNFSPDFPSVAQVLMSLAPEADLPHVDGVISVDPKGLAALLELTGPIEVADWPTPIDSGNVVDVTLRDAYAVYEETPERADFLGDVAEAAVEKATTGSLGKPAQIAKVLGRAAHQGHLQLAFERPEEERLARQLDVSGRLPPVTSDAIAVTTANMAGNKIDPYLQRSVEYHAVVTPNIDATRADVQGTLTTKLDNQAPAEGLPVGVIGPFLPDRFVAGQNRALMSIYSPLTFEGVSVDGQPNPVSTGVERGRNVFSFVTDVFSKSTKTITADLDGSVALRDGWYSLQVQAQPTLNPDQLTVSVEVPAGWKIDDTVRMQQSGARVATAATTLEQSTTYRVHIVHDTTGASLWDRLEAGA
jgi:UDP-N-acetylmuramyl pentapeptide phosphotransferase/UDP-N-acetylglucosamine-1-phosphate transferase/Sec-independent protein translocase protein TatA